MRGNGREREEGDSRGDDKAKRRDESNRRWQLLQLQEQSAGVSKVTCAEKQKSVSRR